MAILVTFFILALVLIPLFLGGSILLQSWMYNVPANRILLRSLISGGGVALFLTLWCLIDSKAPGRYDTLFEFTRYDYKEYAEVNSVYKKGNVEQSIPYKKRADARGKVEFIHVQAGVAKPWTKSDTDGIMMALLVKEENKDEPTRFEVKLENGKFPADIRYIEKGGSRYIETEHIGRIISARSSVFIISLFLNFAHFAAWFCALWLGMRFVLGHALGIGFGLWLFTMILVMPILFNQTRPAPTPKTTPVASSNT